jgi:hypothetical protein
VSGVGSHGEAFFDAISYGMSLIAHIYWVLNDLNPPVVNVGFAAP